MAAPSNNEMKLTETARAEWRGFRSLSPVLGRRGERGLKDELLVPGDVFTLAAKDGMVGCGQVLETERGLPLVAIFQPRFPATPAIPAVLASPVALIVETFDVLVERGEWQVIGAGPRVVTPLLVYRVAIGGVDSQCLESYDRRKTRPALPSEVPLVPNRTSVSPKAVERMFLALHGLAERRERDRDHTLEAIASRAGLLK